jgi:hypothetical protein
LFEIGCKFRLLCNTRLWVSGIGDGLRMQAVSFQVFTAIVAEMLAKNKKEDHSLNWRPFGEYSIVRFCTTAEININGY